MGGYIVTVCWKFSCLVLNFFFNLTKFSPQFGSHFQGHSFWAIWYIQCINSKK